MSPLGYYKRKKRDKPMRARTYIYIVGMAALTLQGCCKKSHPSTPDVERHAIGMAAQSVTRALIEDIGNLSEFAVYGYKQGPVSQMVFTNQLVARSGNAWTYTPTKYWDRTATYSFAAYAPYTAQSGFTYTHDDAYRTLTISMPYWQRIDDDETDIVVATSQGAATTYLNTYGGQVALNFDHLYAQLEVQVVRSAFLENEYTLEALTYSDVPTPIDGTATYTLRYTEGTATLPVTPANTPLAPENNNGKTISAQSVTVENEPHDGTTFKYLVVPFTAQTADGFDITVTYSSGGAQTTTTVNSGIQTLEPNKRYLLRLTINSGADITPTLEMLDWTDQEVDEDDKHNW